MDMKKAVPLTALSGLLASFAFPPAELSFLSWVALAPFLGCLFSCGGRRRAVLLGFIFGLTFFLGVFAWVTSLSRWAGAVAYAAWPALSIFQALFICLFSLSSYIIYKRYGSGLILSLSVPLLWVFTEILRSRGQFASSGGVLGYTQYMNLLVLQTASLLRVYGVSFLIMSSNLAVTLLILNIKDPARARRPAFVFLVLISASLVFGAWKLNTPLVKDQSRGFRIALVQPSFDQEYKMRPSNVVPMLMELERMTTTSKGFRPHAVIWPETAVMDFPLRSPYIMGYLAGAAAGSGAHLVTGAFFYDSGKYYNSAFSFSPAGHVLSRYDKEHLVPFGEYLPFRGLLYPILKGTGYFERDQSSNPAPSLLYIGEIRAGMMICFESMFDDLAAARAKKADFLLTITNDAWFGRSAAARQHIMSGPFRAVENGKYFVQAANSGISAVIDPRGRFIRRSELWEKTVIEAVIYPDTGGR